MHLEVFAVLEGGPMRQYGELEGDLGAPIQGFLASVAKKHKITVVGGTIPLISKPGRQSSDSDYLISDGGVRPASLVLGLAASESRVMKKFTYLMCS
ncbi:MAG: hypothetical protein ACJAY7_001261 [Pseudohongiellaceae bacterium]|jgi:hypothetical protein